MGMKERMAVNIFPSVLPSTYIFIDDGNDNSKWINGPVGTTAWDSIVSGDSYGYYDKGIRFTLDDAAGTGKTCVARRFTLMSPTVQSIFGVIVRPELEMSNVGGFRYLSFEFMWPTAIGGTVMNSITMQIGKRTVMGIYEFSNTIFGGNPALFETTVYQTQNTLGGLPWINFVVMVQDSKVVLYRINNRNYSPAINISTVVPGPIGLRDQSMLTITGTKENDGEKESTSWDVDQIWISENENIV